MGNSFGGLIAAHWAAATTEMSACCINGAMPRITVPDFRTAREQMEAAFGCQGEDLAAKLTEMNFFRTQTPIRCPTLILEGAQDPIVPPGSQIDFVGEMPAVGSRVRLWPDGEHTIYNHAAERNGAAAAWFRDRFLELDDTCIGVA
jgi:pimeloyl-ACP methyl ester carboxylesterase